MKSQKDRVLNWLQAGHTITQLQALRRFGTLRLGAIIYVLRQEHGYDYIATEMIEVENKFSKKIRVARYSLGN